MTSEESHKFSVVGLSAATSIAFDWVGRSLRAAEIQVNRIWDRPVVQGDHHLVTTAFQEILIDVHFYFVALRNIYRFLNSVISDELLQDLRPDLVALNDKWFKHYSLGREAFEHIDQRLPGQKHENKIVEIGDLGNKRKINYGLRLRQGLFLHSDLEWDISKAAFESIKNDVQSLLKRIEEKASKTQQ